MKYKNISAFLHNFGHSFFSYTNYVDGEFIIDILPEAIRSTEEMEVRFQFPSGKIIPEGNYPEKLNKSVGCHAEWLNKHAEHHDINLESLSDIYLSATGSKMGIIYSAQAKDDRGKEYDIPIQQT